MVFPGIKKRHWYEKLALYTIVKNRRNFKHFLDDGAIFITPTVCVKVTHRNEPVVQLLITKGSLHLPLLNLQVFLFLRIIQLGKPRCCDGYLRVPEIKYETLYALYCCGSGSGRIVILIILSVPDPNPL
jgi:hypothetical protein